eukprot:TRINITY_DN387_c0_g2_i15.p1 TRINITY_DN387_c0_g2~~TRINITY_DN387_c0_g2_i15.p1  ORF type:complete len:104 (+),score=9.21 TRINITY_DN387_c0_g2_i15:355-666(+)
MISTTPAAAPHAATINKIGGPAAGCATHEIVPFDCCCACDRYCGTYVASQTQVRLFVAARPCGPHCKTVPRGPLDTDTGGASPGKVTLVVGDGGGATPCNCSS